LYGGVGSGKTIASLAYYMRHQAPKNILVITTALKRDALDWVHEAAMFGIGTVEDATIAGVLVVDSYHNIKKYEKLQGWFVIMDEQRLVGTGAWVKSFLKIARNNEWIMLSATPGDTWLDFVPLFIANGFYKNITEFKREHVVYRSYSKFPSVDRYLSVGKLVRLRNQILVEMPFENHTVRHEEIVKVQYDRDLFRKAMRDRWHVYENRPLRDVSELFIVMRKIVNSHESRLEMVRSLLEKHPKLIVFYNFDYELEELRKLKFMTHMQGLSGPESSNRLLKNSKDSVEKDIPKAFLSGTEWATSKSISTTETSFVVAERNGHKHDPVPTCDSWVYLVQYMAGAEAWNCVDTDAICFYSLTYSYKLFHQAKGRIDRLNTPFVDLYYYNLVSDAPIDRAIRQSLRTKKNFNEAAYGRSLRVKFGKN